MVSEFLDLHGQNLSNSGGRTTDGAADGNSEAVQLAFIFCHVISFVAYTPHIIEENEDWELKCLFQKTHAIIDPNQRKFGLREDMEHR